MGSKGSQTSTTNQNQTYTPAGGSQIQGALTQAQNAAQLPFNIPQAPVAGFSQDQQNAFNTVNNAQGMAQPYINQASQNFTPQGAQSFFNPAVDAVTAQMQNIFGQQQQQNNANLTQSAGGVGADRIAVGQGNLANQQGLAAGQTYSNLWNSAVQQAQGAGYGQAALGSEAQNAALQGAQAQLGTGGLQQQLSQAQLNSPYQQQLAQAAFPYQQAQFLAGITGSLAPALGGTTQGTGTTTSQYNPSLAGQIGGGIGAIAGPLGYALGKGSGGRVPSFAGGGGVDEEPIDISKGYIPTSQLAKAIAQMPSLNLNPQTSQQQQSNAGKGSNSGLNSGLMSLAKMGGPSYGGGSLFGGDAFGGSGSNPLAGLSASDYGAGYARGGYADGGTPEDDPFVDQAWPVGPVGGPTYRMRGLDQLGQEMRAQRGIVDPQIDQPWPTGAKGGPSDDSDSINPGDPVRLPGPEAMKQWADDADRDRALGLTAQGSPASPAMKAVSAAAPASAPTNAPATAAPPALAPTAAAPSTEAPAKEGKSFAGFLKSPYAALTLAGLEAMRTGSLASGMEAGLSSFQKQTSVDQAAKRLELEAKHHEDQYTRSTPYQQFEMKKPVPIGQRVDPLTGMPMTTYGSLQPDGSFKPVDAAGKPIDDPGALPPKSSPTQGWLPGTNVPDNVNPGVLAQTDEGTANMVRAIDEGRAKLTDVPMRQRFMVERLLHAYDSKWDGTIWNLRNKQNGDLATNGTAGKMLTAVNQLLPHLATGYDKAVALANSNYPAANTIKNWWLTQTGDPRTKEFATVREVASMDAARLLRGSGQMAEKDIEEWRQNIGSSGSPAQLVNVLKLLGDDLIGARITSLQHAYRQNMRQEPPEFLSAEAKTALERIKGGGAGAAPAGGAARPDPAARFGQLTSGGMTKEQAYAKMHEEGY